MIIHNPTETAVRDYPIQDPKSGEVALWSIMPGETLDFPEHEGRYLLDIYRFLQRIITPEQQEAEQREEARLNKGQHFSQVKIVGGKGFTNENMQPPAPSPEDLKPKNPVVTPPDQQPNNNPPPPPAPDMAGAVVGDESEAVHAATPTQAPAPSAANPPVKAGKLTCPECQHNFANKAALKTHYAHQHLTIPGLE